LVAQVPVSEAVRRAADALLERGRVAARHQTRRTAAGCAIHHIESGAGRPLLLLHGAGGGGANWYRVMAALAEEHRVLAPDLPGFAESEPIEAVAPLGTGAADLISGWLDSVAEPPWAVAGTSFGALVALRLAQLRPADVAGLVLIDAAGLGPTVPWLIRAAADARLGRFLLSPSRFGTRFLFETLLVADRGALPAGDQAALIDYLYQSDLAGGASLLRQTLGLFAGWRGQREVLTDAELGALAVPTRVVWGERDRFFPSSHGQRCARLVSGADFVLVPRSGHSPNWEAPAAVLRALTSFLASLSSRA
jgi:pimeloyl-ACP methyl ester carboxylesterase